MKHQALRHSHCLKQTMIRHAGAGLKAVHGESKVQPSRMKRAPSESVAVEVATKAAGPTTTTNGKTGVKSTGGDDIRVAESGCAMPNSSKLLQHPRAASQPPRQKPMPAIRYHRASKKAGLAAAAAVAVERLEEGEPPTVAVDEL